MNLPKYFPPSLTLSRRSSLVFFSLGKLGCFVAILLCLNTPSHADIVTAGLVDWFDADTGVTTSGGSVTGWANQATGNNVTVADPQTSVVVGSNGQAMIRFNNPADGAGLQYGVSGSLDSGYTAIATVRLNDTYENIGNSFPRFLRTTNDAQGPLFMRSDSRIEIKANPIGSGSRPTKVFESDDGGPFGIGDTAIIAAELTPTRQALYFNGLKVDERLINVSSYSIANTDTWEIGNSVVGDIGDVLVYDNTLTAAGFQETGAQLAADYGIAYGADGFAPTDRPAVYLPFDGNVDNLGTSDASPQLQAGASGTTSFVPGEFGGQALNIDVATNQTNGPRVAVNNYTLADSGTISLRYFAEDFFNFQTILDNSVDGNDWEAWIYNDGRVAFRIDADTFMEFDLDTLEGANEWYDLAFTWERDGTDVDTELYVDGILRDTASGTWVDPGTLFFGSGNSGNTPGNGIWDNAAIFERRLDFMEIAALANGGSIATAPVPEPASLAVWALLGLIAFRFARKRRRNAMK